jgi:hypothetical protein
MGSVRSDRAFGLNYILPQVFLAASHFILAFVQAFSVLGASAAKAGAATTSKKLAAIAALTTFTIGISLNDDRPFTMVRESLYAKLMPLSKPIKSKLYESLAKAPQSHMNNLQCLFHVIPENLP